MRSDFLGFADELSFSRAEQYDLAPPGLDSEANRVRRVTTMVYIRAFPNTPETSNRELKCQRYNKI